MNKVGTSIQRGLSDAVAFAKGEADPKAFRIHVPKKVDVKAIRTGLGMTQQGFAGRYGFNVHAVRDWELGTRQPESGTRAYLLVIENNPEGVALGLRRAHAGA